MAWYLKQLRLAYLHTSKDKIEPYHIHQLVACCLQGLACRGRDALPPQSQSRSGPGAHSMVMNRYEKWSWRLAKSSDDRKFLKVSFRKKSVHFRCTKSSTPDCTLFAKNFPASSASLIIFS